jgi:hypothetical protein
VAFSSSKDTLFWICSLLQRVGYKGMVHRAFSERRKEECVRRYAIRGGGGALDNRSRVGGIGDVHAGAALAVRKRL